MFKTLLQARQRIAELATSLKVEAPKVRSLQEARTKIEAFEKQLSKKPAMKAQVDGGSSFNENGAGRSANPTNGNIKPVPASKANLTWREQVQATDDYAQKLRIIQGAQAAKRAEIESLPPNQRWAHYESLKQISHAEAYVRQARDTVSSAKERAARKILDNQGL